MYMMNVRWLMNNAIFNDLQEGQTVEQLWDQKLNDLSDSFIQSVMDNGILATCDYDKSENVFYNGHHRLLVAWLLDIEEIRISDENDDFDATDWGYIQKGFVDSRGRLEY